jgi:hypothetical protein
MTVFGLVCPPRRLAVATVALGVLAAGPAGTAFAEAGGPASCVGHEASSISPPGSSEEVPGGMPDLVRFIRAEVPGPPGSFVSAVARLHEGSHEACDEAIE